MGSGGDQRYQDTCHGTCGRVAGILTSGMEGCSHAVKCLLYFGRPSPAPARLEAAHQLFALAQPTRHAGAQRRPPRRLQVFCWACGDNRSSRELARLQLFCAVLPVPQSFCRFAGLAVTVGGSSKPQLLYTCEQRDTQIIIWRDFCTIHWPDSGHWPAGGPLRPATMQSLCIPLSAAPLKGTCVCTRSRACLFSRPLESAATWH